MTSQIPAPETAGSEGVTRPRFLVQIPRSIWQRGKADQVQRADLGQMFLQVSAPRHKPACVMCQPEPTRGLENQDPFERIRGPARSGFQVSSSKLDVGKKIAGGRVHERSTTHVPYLGCACCATSHPEATLGSEWCCGTRMPLASRQRVRGQPVMAICTVQQA